MASKNNSPARLAAASSSTCPSLSQENSNSAPARNHQVNSRNLLRTRHRTIKYQELTRTGPEGRKTKARTRSKKAQPLIRSRMGGKKKELAPRSAAVQESDFFNQASNPAGSLPKTLASSK